MTRLALLGLMLVLAGCSGGSRAATRQPSAVRGVERTADSLAGPWAIRGVERPRAQRVDVSAELESRIDSVSRVDSLATRAWYDWAEHPQAAQRRVVGMVRAFALRSGSDSLWRVLDAPALPVSFVAEVPWPGSVPELQLPRADGCDPQAAIVPGWRETWVSPPRELSLGTTWRDSSESPLCRDGILLETSMVRVFVVETAIVRDGQLRIVVRRRSQGSIRGSGLQFGDSVRFLGDVRGEARLELLPEGAIIAHGDGHSELRLTMRGRRRTQELVQRSALVIGLP